MIHEKVNDTVVAGPFKNTVIPIANRWSGSSDTGSKLLGLYEQQILNEIVEIHLKCITRNKKLVLINLGSADGYYAIGGCVAGIFEYAYCFEKESLSNDDAITFASNNCVENQISFLVR